MDILPFAQQNKAEVWPRIQNLLKLLFELKVLNESKQSMFWVRSAFGNVLFSIGLCSHSFNFATVTPFTNITGPPFPNSEAYLRCAEPNLIWIYMSHYLSRTRQESLIQD